MKWGGGGAYTVWATRRPFLQEGWARSGLHQLPRVHSAGNKAHWSPEAEKELQQARGHCPSLQVDNRRGMSAGLGRGIEGQPTTTEQTYRRSGSPSEPAEVLLGKLLKSLVVKLRYSLAL